MSIFVKVEEPEILGLFSILFNNSSSVFPTCLSIKCPPFSSCSANPPLIIGELLSSGLALSVPLSSAGFLFEPFCDGWVLDGFGLGVVVFLPTVPVSSMYLLSTLMQTPAAAEWS